MLLGRMRSAGICCWLLALLLQRLNRCLLRDARRGNSLAQLRDEHMQPFRRQHALSQVREDQVIELVHRKVLALAGAVTLCLSPVA